MTIIADTSYLFALYNSKDINHRAAAAFAFETASERLLLPDVALTELAYLLVRDIGFVALHTLLENLRSRLGSVWLNRVGFRRAAALAAKAFCAVLEYCRASPHVVCRASQAVSAKCF